MSNVLESIEQKIKSFQEDLKNKSTYLTNIEQAINKLVNDKQVTISDINKLQGAIHGYSESFRLMQEGVNPLPVEEKING